MKKLSLPVTSLLLVLMFLSPVTQGELYKWVDESGRIHYGDSPPDKAKLKEITGSVSSFTSVSVEPFVYDSSLVTGRQKSKSVDNIPFTEHDIEKSETAAREYKKLRGRGVPVILIGDQRMNGFSAKTFDAIYYGKS
jgi:glutaredoxin